jgi:hypothetical protein
MDQAESQPLPGQPERPVPGAAQPGGPQPHGRPFGVPSPSDGPGPAMELDHPVVVGYDGSGSSRHALAYAAGMARRLGRPLLLAYITSPSIFCEPLSGQVIAPIRDSDATQPGNWPPQPTSSVRTHWSSARQRGSGTRSRDRCQGGWPGTRTAR